jgi:hypothetical protein
MKERYFPVVVAGRGGGPYRMYPCCKKSLVTQLSNIVIKLEKNTYLKIVTYIIEMMYC